MTSSNVPEPLSGAFARGSLPRMVGPVQALLLRTRRLAIRAYSLATVAVAADVRRAAALGAEGGVVLNLHSVSPDRRSLSGPLSPEAFDALLSWLKRHFRVVTLQDIERSGRGDQRPFAVLSFDDGYRDFIEYAMPALERHGLRANQNIVPACVESGLPPWNVRLLDLLRSLPPDRLQAIRLAGLEYRCQGSAHAARLRFSAVLSRFLKMRPRAERQPLLDELMAQLGQYGDGPTTPMLSKGDLVEVASRHEVGLHSYEHDSMEFESDDFFQKDIDRCLTWSRRNLPSTPTVYAFPNGSHRTSQIRIATASGFRRVLLVGEKPSRVGAAVHPRISVYGADALEVRTRIARAR